ncbi:hypothetical protein WA158_005463 [Blastocystis sp. Blastoise]
MDNNSGVSTMDINTFMEKLSIIQKSMKEIAQSFLPSLQVSESNPCKPQSVVSDTVNQYLESEYKRLEKISNELKKYEKDVSDITCSFSDQLKGTYLEGEDVYATIQTKLSDCMNNYSNVTNKIDDALETIKDPSHICFKIKNSEKKYLISKGILENNKGTILSTLYNDSSNHDKNGDIYIDRESKMFPVIIEYLNGEEIDYSFFSEKEKLEIINEFEYFKIPFNHELLNLRGTYKEHMMVNGYLYNRVIMVNGKNEPELNSYLMAHQLFDTLFKKQRVEDIHYYEDTGVVYINLKLDYIDYIRQYITSNTIDLKQLKPHPIHTDGFIAEFEQLSIPLALDIVTLFTPLYESLLLDETLAGHVLEWTGMDKQWFLAYRGSNADFDVTSFHNHCDNKGECIVLVCGQLDESMECLFGAYTSVGFNIHCLDENQDIEDNDAFLFTLRNNLQITPERYNAKQSIMVHYDADCGPSFTNGFMISNHSHTSFDNYFYTDGSFPVIDHHSFMSNFSFGKKNKTFKVLETEVYIRA